MRGRFSGCTGEVKRLDQHRDLTSGPRSKSFFAWQPTRRPWRRFARFSVRGLVSLILLIGAVLGWLVRSAHIQRDAVAAIRRAGGSVMYDWQWKNGEPNANGKLRWPKWLRSRRSRKLETAR